MTRILVPTDFSHTSQKALELARTVFPDPHITLLHVYDPQATMAVYNQKLLSHFTLDEFEAVLLGASQQQLQQLQHAGEGVRITSGRPAQEIVNAAKELHADFIVMGSHARRGFPIEYLGSVTHAVLQTTPVPVLVVRLPEVEGTSDLNSTASQKLEVPVV